MSAVKIGAGRLEMNNMPATAPMTVWPEETVAPTTRHCAEVCNFKCPQKYVFLLVSTVECLSFTVQKDVWQCLTQDGCFHIHLLKLRHFFVLTGNLI